MYLRNRFDNALLLPHQWIADRVAYFCDRTCFWLALMMSELYLILAVALGAYWLLTPHDSSVRWVMTICTILNSFTALKNIKEAKASQLRFDAGQPILHREAVINRPREYLFLFCLAVWLFYLVLWLIGGSIGPVDALGSLWLLTLITSEYFLVCYPNIPKRKRQIVPAFSAAAG